MKSALMVLGFVAGMLGQSAPAAPALATEAQKVELEQCVVMRTNGADRLLTAQWIFAAMAKSPNIESLSAVSDQRRAELDKAFAKLLTRIVVKDCIDQVRPLAVANFEESFELVGKALGEVAMQELLGNPVVDKAIGNYADYLSEDDFKPLIDSVDKAQSK